MRDIELKPYVAALLFLYFGVLFALVFWANGEKVSQRGPELISVAPNGNLFIGLQNVLFEYGQDDKLVARHDAGKFGMDSFIGDIAFFADGQLLIRLGEAEHSVLDNIFTFMRLPQFEAEQPLSKAREGLHRCELPLANCRPFEAKGMRDDRAFGLAIDQANGTVYFSDTPSGAIYQFGEQGFTLGSLKEGLIFPNRMVLEKRSLYVVNTNHHEVLEIYLDTPVFGSETVRHSVRVLGEDKWIWPYSLIQFGSGWIVNLLDGAMSNGRLAEFDSEWNFVRWLPLPADADPIELAWFGDTLFVTDYDGNRVHRFDTNGQRLAEFAPPALQAAQHSVDERRAYYEKLVFLGIGLMLLSVIAGVLFALIKGRVRNTVQTFHDEICEKAISEPMEWLLPEAKQRIIALVGYMFIWLVMVGFLVMLWKPAFTASSFDWHSVLFLSQSLLSVLIISIFLWAGYRGLGVWAVRVRESAIELKHKRGKCLVVPLREIVASKDYNSLIVESVCLTLRRPNKRAGLYPKEPVERELIPRLRAGGVMPASELAFVWRYIRSSSRVEQLAYVLIVVWVIQYVILKVAS